jgi:GDPmannose 4,6-dehydratase
VREFAELAFKELGIEVEWKGKGVDEIGVCAKTGKTIIKIDPAYFRPTEVDLLVGDYSKAKKLLGWEPKTTFKELVKIMVQADWERVQKTIK